MLCDHDDYDCFRKPTSYSFNFISMVPNMTVPVQGTGLFNLQTTVWAHDLEFDIKIENIYSPPHVEKASEQFFKWVAIFELDFVVKNYESWILMQNLRFKKFTSKSSSNLSFCKYWQNSLVSKFSLRKVPQGVTLQLLRPLDGPQDIEIELTMNVFTRERLPSGSSVAKVFVLVSEYPF